MRRDLHLCEEVPLLEEYIRRGDQGGPPTHGAEVEHIHSPGIQLAVSILEEGGRRGEEMKYIHTMGRERERGELKITGGHLVIYS